jgi:phosphoribosylglycinamide formyltransferase
LTRAANFGIPSTACALKTYLNKNAGATRADYDAEIARLVNESKPDLVVLAGWMHILSPTFLDLVHAPIINLHPALPGAFDGANAIGRAHEAYQKGEIQKTGAMVHRVVAEVDRGEPLVVREIAMKDETLEQLENRIHEASHQVGKADDRWSMKSLCRERASRSSWP